MSQLPGSRNLEPRVSNLGFFFFTNVATPRSKRYFFCTISKCLFPHAFELDESPQTVAHRILSPPPALFCEVIDHKPRTGSSQLAEQFGQVLGSLSALRDFFFCRHEALRRFALLLQTPHVPRQCALFLRSFSAGNGRHDLGNFFCAFAPHPTSVYCLMIPLFTSPPSSDPEFCFLDGTKRFDRRPFYSSPAPLFAGSLKSCNLPFVTSLVVCARVTTIVFGPLRYSPPILFSLLGFFSANPE